MRYLRILAILGICLGSASFAHAQRVVVGIGVGGPAYYGPPPVCAYGYYPDYPYACAPYGYYGPDWFAGDVFIGAGPWFHGFYGRPGFYGRGYSWRGFRDEDDFDRERGFRDGRDFDGWRGFHHDGRGFHDEGRFHEGRGFRGREGFHGEHGSRGRRHR